MRMENKEIIKKIQELKKIKPSSEWLTLNRDFLLRECKASLGDVPMEKISWQDYGQYFVRLFSQRMFEPAIVILLLLGVFLSSSLIVNAAFYSLPGDYLYQVKIALERTQVAITPDEGKKVELKMEFAKKRVEELDKIVAQPDITPEAKKEKINVAVNEFKKNVVAVKEHIDKVSKPVPNPVAADQEQNLRMAIAVSSKTNELVKALDEQTNSLSEEEKVGVGEIVADAIFSAQQTNQSAEDLIKEEAINSERENNEESSQEENIEIATSTADTLSTEDKTGVETTQNIIK